MKRPSKFRIIVGVCVLALVGAGLLLARGTDAQRAQTPPTPPTPAVTEEATPQPAPGAAYAATNPKEWTVYAKIVIAYPKVKPTTEAETYAASPNLGGTPSEEAGDIRRVFPKEGLDVTLPDEKLIAQLEVKDPNFTYVVIDCGTVTSKDGQAVAGGTTGLQKAIEGPDCEYSFSLSLRIEPTGEAGWVKVAREGDDVFVCPGRPGTGTTACRLFGPSFLLAEGGTYGALDKGPGWSESGPSPDKIEKREVIGVASTVLYGIVPAEEA